MQEYLIDTCWTMLKPNGILLINEVIPNAIFDWRMSMYTNGGRSISIEDIRELTKDQWEENRYENHERWLKESQQEYLTKQK